MGSMMICRISKKIFMKKKLLVLAISFLSLKGFSQGHQVTVYAEIYANGGIDYMGVEVGSCPIVSSPGFLKNTSKSPKKEPEASPTAKKPIEDDHGWLEIGKRCYEFRWFQWQCFLRHTLYVAKRDHFG